jgi:hypothetical protein
MSIICNVQIFFIFTPYSNINTYLLTVRDCSNPVIATTIITEKYIYLALDFGGASPKSYFVRPDREE